MKLYIFSTCPLVIMKDGWWLFPLNTLKIIFIGFERNFFLFGNFNLFFFVFGDLWCFCDRSPYNFLFSLLNFYTFHMSWLWIFIIFTKYWNIWGIITLNLYPFHSFYNYSEFLFDFCFISCYPISLLISFHIFFTS